MSQELPPEFGQYVPRWFRDMSDCGMMLLWLVLALVLTLLTNAYGVNLRPDRLGLAWLLTGISWGVVLLHVGLCARAWWQRT